MVVSLKVIKKKLAPHIEGTSLSCRYLALFTGSSAYLFNRKLERITKIKKLSYVYDGSISPDEKHLLLIGSKNEFMIYSLESLELELKYKVPKPYNAGLRGIGGWSFDGKSILVMPSKENSPRNTLRLYCAKDLNIYNDYRENTYMFLDYTLINHLKMYAILAFDLLTRFYFVLIHDGINLCKVIRVKVSGEKYNFSHINYDFCLNCFELSEWGSIIRIDYNGEAIDERKNSDECDFKKFVFEVNNSNDEGIEIWNIIEKFDLGKFLSRVMIEGIFKIVPSINKKFLFVVTNMNIWVISTESGEVICKAKTDFDITGFQEFDDETFVVTSKYDVVIYRFFIDSL